MCVSMHSIMCVGLRVQLCGVYSLIITWVQGINQIVRLVEMGSNHLYPLSHMVSPV